jgi:hypothetical protein
MHIQFWWAFFVLTLGPDLRHRSNRSRCSLKLQRMNSLRILSSYRSLTGFASASRIEASALWIDLPPWMDLPPWIDLVPGLFFVAAEVDIARASPTSRRKALTVAGVVRRLPRAHRLAPGPENVVERHQGRQRKAAVLALTSLFVPFAESAKGTWEGRLRLLHGPATVSMTGSQLAECSGVHSRKPPCGCWGIVACF